MSLPTESVQIAYADDSPPMAELRQEAIREVERLRRHLAEIEAALHSARNKPSGDNSSRKYLRLWKAVHAARLKG